MSDNVILDKFANKGVSTRFCNFLLTVINYLHFFSFLPTFAHILSWYTERSECTLHLPGSCIEAESPLTPGHDADSSDQRVTDAEMMISTCVFTL